MKPIPQSSLEAQVAGDAGVSTAAARSVLLAYSGIAIAELKAGRPVLVPGIGRIRPAPKPARTARSPRTGEEIEVPARLGARLALGTAAKRDLNLRARGTES